MSTLTLDQMRAERDRQLGVQRRRRYKKLELDGVEWSRVPAGPAQERLQQLLALGWGVPAIIDWYGTGTPSGMLRIANGASRTVQRRLAGLADLPLTVSVDPKIADRRWVPGLGAARRTQALIALGWTHEHIIEHTGLDTRGADTHQITACTWRLIDHAFIVLSGRPGPSDRNRERARKMRYAPPLAWDDIDDPLEQPQGLRRAH